MDRALLVLLRWRDAAIRDRLDLMVRDVQRQLCLPDAPVEDDPLKEQLPTVAQVSRRDGEILSVQALPLPKGSHVAVGTMIRQRLAACALVVHGAASRIPTIGVQLLRHLYGLTPAEVQVAPALAERETLKWYADRRRMSRNTAASQLKRAFDKTRLRRQSELVRWLLQCGATLRPGTIT